jgi:hypothetical protein
MMQENLEKKYSSQHHALQVMTSHTTSENYQASRLKSIKKMVYEITAD